MRDHEEAKDVLQDTLVVIFSKLDQYHMEENSFKPWIKRICINTALQKFRKKGYYNEIAHDVMPDTRSVSPDVYSKLGKDELMEVINQLPELYKNVFCLYVIEDYTHAEIAEEMNMKESSSRSALTRAKKMLKEKLWSLQKVVA